MNRRLVAGTVALAAALAGCASIVTGTQQTISVSSNVDGADVLLDGLKIGTTPFAGPVPKNKGMLTVQKDGYRSQSVALSTTMEPIFWGNIIIGGTLGSITDFASGAAFQYAPASYQVELKAAGQAQADYERQVAARKFAMIYLDKISADLARGSGEHLGALLAIVNDGRAGRASAEDVRQALAASRADAVEFGRRVVGMI